MTAEGAQADGALEEMCPHYVAPNPWCVTEPVPGEGWIVSGMHPPARSALRLYRSLVPRWFAMPREPMVGFVSPRLNVPGQPGGSSQDPGDGYMEEAVMIRVRHGAEEGWFPLATAVNDSSEYTEGRWIGIPKWLADEHVTQNRAANRWNFWATPQGEPNRTAVRLVWSPHAYTTRAAPGCGRRKKPPARRERARGGDRKQRQRQWMTSLRSRRRGRSSCDAKRRSWTPSSGDIAALARLTTYADPMFTVVRPWDVPDPDRFPERVKFTLSPYAPSTDLVTPPATTYTGLPAPRLGTTEVTVSPTVGPSSLPIWRELVAGDASRPVPGMFWHGSGFVYITSERLDGQPGPPGKP